MGTGWGPDGVRAVFQLGSSSGRLDGLPLWDPAVLERWDGVVSWVGGWNGCGGSADPFEGIRVSVEPCVLIVRRGCEVAGCSNLRETLDAASGEAGQRDPLLTIGDAGER